MNIKNPLPDESLITLVWELFIYTDFLKGGNKPRILLLIPPHHIQTLFPSRLVQFAFILTSKETFFR